MPNQKSPNATMIEATENRRDEREHVDAGGLGGRDLVVSREPAEGGEDRDHHRHGNCHERHPGETQQEGLEHGEPRDSLRDEEVEVVDDEVHGENEVEDGEPRGGGRDVRSENVPGQNAHVGSGIRTAIAVRGLGRGVGRRGARTTYTTKVAAHAISLSAAAPGQCPRPGDMDASRALRMHAGREPAGDPGRLDRCGLL